MSYLRCLALPNDSLSNMFASRINDDCGFCNKLTCMKPGSSPTIAKMTLLRRAQMSRKVRAFREYS